MKAILTNLAILSLLLFVPSVIMAQMVIDDCGVFKAGVEGGCVLFDSDHYGEYLFMVFPSPTNPDPMYPYEIGDRARIQGIVTFDCVSYCMQGDGCIFDAILTDCDEDYICGDFNGDGIFNILDIAYLINYIYKGGPPPVPLQSANVNYGIDQNSAINILDVVYFINFKYKGGPPPVCP